MDHQAALRCGFLHILHGCLLPRPFSICIIELHRMGNLLVFLIHDLQHMIRCKSGTGQITDHIYKLGPVFIRFHQKRQGVCHILHRLLHEIIKHIGDLAVTGISIDPIQVIKEKPDSAVRISTVGSRITFPGKEIVEWPVNIIHNAVHSIMPQHIRHIHRLFQTCLSLRIIKIRMKLSIIFAEPGTIHLVWLVFCNVIFPGTNGRGHIIPGVFFLQLDNAIIFAIDEQDSRPCSGTDNSGFFSKTADHIPFNHGSFMIGTAVSQHQTVIRLSCPIACHIRLKKVIMESWMIHVVLFRRDQLDALLVESSGTVT